MCDFPVRFDVYWKVFDIYQSRFLVYFDYKLTQHLSKSKEIMGARTRTAKYAVGFTFLAFVLILIAFSTPYWLQTDGVLKRPKFENLGEFGCGFLYVKLIVTILILWIWYLQDCGSFAWTTFRTSIDSTMWDSTVACGYLKRNITLFTISCCHRSSSPCNSSSRSHLRCCCSRCCWHCSFWDAPRITRSTCICWSRMDRAWSSLDAVRHLQSFFSAAMVTHAIGCQIGSTITWDGRSHWRVRAALHCFQLEFCFSSKLVDSSTRDWMRLAEMIQLIRWTSEGDMDIPIYKQKDQRRSENWKYFSTVQWRRQV